MTDKKTNLKVYDGKVQMKCMMMLFEGRPQQTATSDWIWWSVETALINLHQQIYQKIIQPEKTREMLNSSKSEKSSWIAWNA